MWRNCEQSASLCREYEACVPRGNKRPFSGEGSGAVPPFSRAADRHGCSTHAAAVADNTGGDGPLPEGPGRPWKKSWKPEECGWRGLWFTSEAWRSHVSVFVWVPRAFCVTYTHRSAPACFSNQTIPVYSFFQKLLDQILQRNNSWRKDDGSTAALCDRLKTWPLPFNWAEYEFETSMSASISLEPHLSFSPCLFLSFVTMHLWYRDQHFLENNLSKN